MYDGRGEALPGLLSSLPPSLSSLTHLQHLDLSFNQLTELPPPLLLLPQLQSLLLCQNLLSSLPSDLGGLSSLRHLSLLGNRLRALPPSLQLPPTLHTLDVSYNQLQQLPDSLGERRNIWSRLKQLQEKHHRVPDTQNPPPGCLADAGVSSRFSALPASPPRLQ